MAVDLGGTNFRVCSIQLHGNTTFSLTQSKVKVPADLMTAKTAKELFAFLAKQIEAFLKQHHNDHYSHHVSRRETSSVETGSENQEIFNLGFTFSFPVQQVSINKGHLMRWTKGFDIPDAVGKDVCGLLQAEIDALDLPVRVAALVNDTVGTLMARSYTSPGKTGTLLGAIFGTGTNGAYVEKLNRITKLTRNAANEGSFDTSTGEMIVNTEWGSFDNALTTLPTSTYDVSLDKDTPNPGIQMFEKRISGMYLGEIFRRAIVGLLQDVNVPLFSDEDSATNDLHTTTNINKDSRLYEKWGIDSSFLSTAGGDKSDGLRITRQAIQNDLGVDAPSAEDAEAVRMIACAIGKRAARLSAVAVGATVIRSERLDQKPAGADLSDDDMIDVGVDGSLVEFYPGFEGYIREA
jgi:hexokinase